MNDVRGWIEEKLRENGFSSSRLPNRQLVITRDSHADARVLCVGLAKGEFFDADDFIAAVEEAPSIEFVVVVPTHITNAAYALTEELGICVAGFGELTNALRNDDRIAEHIDSQEQFERRRLKYNKAVNSIKRKGHHAYEIQRKEHRSLTIITTNVYEFTADGLYGILESYEDINPDLIVVTNPNCRGFATHSRRAADQAGIGLVRFVDFLEDLGSKWT